MAPKIIYPPHLLLLKIRIFHLGKSSIIIMAILQAFITLVVMYMIYNIFKIFQNYIKARKCGFPMFISPIEQISPFWIIFSPLLLPICKKFLPYTLWRPLDLCSYGFEWRDYVSGRTRPSNWMLIGPGKLDLYVEDPFIATMILSKKKDFPMDEISRKFLNVVGPNLLSSEGEDWQRQRRLIAPMLNERIMENVWNESRDQANDMVSSFLNDGGTTKDTISGLKRIAFNVLQCIGYGMPQKWNQNVREILPGHKLAYMEALHELVDGFIIIAIIRSIKIMTIPFMPVFLKRKGYALQDFLLYTKEMLETERKAIIESDQPRNSLLSLLSTISERRLNNESSDSSTDQKQTLSEGEIVGNLYQFTLAGFDTTATTLAYAVTTLAARPEWQNWIVEEIDKIRESIDNKSSYSEVFPRLERCLALMVCEISTFLASILLLIRFIVRDIKNLYTYRSYCSILC